MNVRRYFVLLLLAAVVVGVLRFGRNVDLRSAVEDGDDPQIAELRDFDEFAVFYAGKSVSGYPLEAVLRSPGQNSVTFIYGTCEPSGPESNCVSVQVWSACARSLSTAGSRHGLPTVAPATVRGAPVSAFEGGRRLELQTADSTIVISADDPLPVAEALRGVNNDVKAGEPLPERVLIEPAECPDFVAPVG